MHGFIYSFVSGHEVYDCNSYSKKILTISDCVLCCKFEKAIKGNKMELA